MIGCPSEGFAVGDLPKTELPVAGGTDVPIGHGLDQLGQPRSLEDERSERGHLGRLCDGRGCWKGVGGR